MIRVPRIRFLLVGLTVLVVLQVVLAFSAFVSLTHDDKEGFRLPLPHRIASMVAMVERTAVEDRTLATKAMTSERVMVWIATTDDLELPVEPNVEVPSAIRAVKHQLDTLGDREVQAWLVRDANENWKAPRNALLRLWSHHPMRIAVSLKTSEWLVVETTGNHAEGILGTPSGFWAGMLGVVVATFALLTLWRGLAPLEELARSIEAFALRPEPIFVKARGPRETRRVIDAVNSMQNELAGFVAERRVMFGALSHDLRTYLTRLKLRLASVVDDELRAGAESDVNAMGDIIKDGLLLAKLDAEPTPEHESFAIGPLIDEIVSSRRMDAQHVRLIGDVRRQTLVTDRISLVRALENLLDNAVTYGGAAELEAYSNGNDVVLSVLDRGPGMRPDQIARLMQPFERGDTARSQETPGTGLGLAIVSRSVARCGGTFAIQARRSGGLIACIRLRSTSIVERPREP